MGTQSRRAGHQDRSFSAHALAGRSHHVRRRHRRDEGRPRHRRYVRVEVPGLGQAYQTALVVADMPRRWAFPGGAGEWFAHTEDVPYPVDWYARVRPVANEEAQVKARRRHRQLAQQVDEHSGETTGPPSSLEEALAAMDDERAELAANPGDCQLLTTIVFSTWSYDLRQLESQAERLSSMFAPLDYQLVRPTGGQAQLLRAGSTRLGDARCGSRSTPSTCSRATSPPGAPSPATTSATPRASSWPSKSTGSTGRSSSTPRTGLRTSTVRAPWGSSGRWGGGRATSSSWSSPACWPGAARWW